MVERLTEKRDGQWVIPLRKDGKRRWSLFEYGGAAASYLYGDHANRLAAYEDAMPLERVQELAQAEKDDRAVHITRTPNDPLTLEQIQEMADDIADDFISYVTGGVQNAAPYCANMRTECCERPGWCTGYSKSCKGFFPKAYCRQPEEGEK